jgi:hypothetical protein
MNFNTFWKWLCKNQRTIQNLGGRKYKGKPRCFKIKAGKSSGTATPLSTKRTSPFTQQQANQVWQRYQRLPGNEKRMAGRYVDGLKKHNWNPCPNRKCSPYLAAAIQDFLAGNP